jgi:hypothetical protein
MGIQQDFTNHLDQYFLNIMTNEENTFWVKMSAWAVVLVVIATGVAIIIGFIYF